MMRTSVSKLSGITEIDGSSVCRRRQDRDRNDELQRQVHRSRGGNLDPINGYSGAVKRSERATVEVASRLCLWDNSQGTSRNGVDTSRRRVSAGTETAALGGSGAVSISALSGRNVRFERDDSSK